MLGWDGVGWGERSGMCGVRDVNEGWGERSGMCGVRDVGEGWGGVSAVVCVV